MNIGMLGISELKWTGIGVFNPDDHYIYYCGQESLRGNGVALTVKKKSLKCSTLGNLKNHRMISVHFQGKPFNITVIQVYAPTINTEEVEGLRPKRPSRTNTKKRCPFHHKKLEQELELKSRTSRNTWSNRQVWPWSTLEQAKG